MRQFSDPHLAALVVLTTVALASIWAPQRHPGRWVSMYARTLALLIAAAWVGEYVADVINGIWTVKYDLPLQLTDAVSLVAIVALLTRRQLAVELLFFWALTASLQATLTPDLGQTFPSIYFFTYFTYHVGAIAAACLLVFGCHIYPRARAAWRVFAITLGFAAAVGLADLLTGGNYMYLRAKPAHNSLLNLMGPWPWYLASTGLLALAMLFVLQLLADLACRGESRRSRLPGGGERAGAPVQAGQS